MTKSSIRTTVLENGLTIVTERMDDVRSVAVGYWVGVGSRDEPDDLAGASHFLEHLLFKGTPTRSASDIAEAMDEVGGDLNAFTTKEYTAFEVRLLAEDLDLGLDVLSDIFWSPSFRPDEVETEREVILDEILGALEEPADLVHDLLIEALFPNHPLGRSILGVEPTIEALTPDEIAGFHAAHYAPERVVVAAAGAVDHDAIVRGVAKRVQHAGGAPVPLDRAEPVHAAMRELRVARDTEQVHLTLGLPGLHRTSPDRYALELLVQALGGGLSSRLFQEVRERRGLAYNVYASRGAYADAGLVSLYAGTAPRNVAAVMDLLRAELADVALSGITERELAIAKGHVRASILLGLEDSGARMGRLARSQMVHGEVPPIDDVLQHFASVTLDDVGRVAGEVLDGEPTLVVIGPPDEA